MIDVFIVGAQKAGTTSILRYLQSHPDVTTHEHMEMTYFYIDEEYEKGDPYLAEYYGLVDNSKKCIVAKHATMTRSEKALERLARHNSKCKIIFCIRDPVERAFSSYLMEKRNGSIRENFDEVMEIAFREREKHWYYNVFIELGLYSRHLHRVMKYFPEDQIRIVNMEVLHGNRETLMNELFQWIGCTNAAPRIDTKKHNSKDEVSIHIFKRLGKKMPWMKGILLETIGRRRIEKLAKYLASRFTNRKDSIESLDQYVGWRQKLTDFYSVHTHEIES